MSRAASRRLRVLGVPPIVQPAAQVPAIVVAGECLVDLLAEPGGDVAARPGGGPFNVARGLARLAVRTAFAGVISTDAFGRRLRAELASDGVDLRWAPPSDLPTTLALAELGPDGARYRFYTENTAAPSLADASAVPLGAAVHVGSLGLVLEPMATALEGLVSRAAGRALVMADPNWRPAAIADPAAQRARLGRLLALADVVKVSTEDLEHLAPAAGADAGRALLSGRTRCVVVTDGPRPVRAVWPGGELAVEVPRGEVVDTVGAGDAFCAGFLAWWTTRRHGTADLDDPRRLEPALAFAAHVASLTCARQGAEPPRREELDEHWRARLASVGVSSDG